MQRELRDHEWPGAEQLRVRMGIHTGEAAEAATGLVGYEVHRAARVAAVGHGGQTLLSSAAAGLVEDALPAFVYARNKPSEVIDVIREALAIFRQLGDHSWVTTMLIFMSLAQDESMEGVREARVLNAEALELAEEIGSTFHRLILWSNAGSFSHLLGDYDQALLYSRRAFNLSRRNGGSVEDDYWTIFTLSCVATLQGHLLLGAQLAGAHDGIEERATEPLGEYWSQREIDALDNNRVLLREALGDEYERAIAVGKNLNANRIYDLAMGRSEPVR
jgi:tetratricopeptide (TPR) repeat protein